MKLRNQLLKEFSQFRLDSKLKWYLKTKKMKRKTILEKSGPILTLLQNPNSHKSPSQNPFKTTKCRPETKKNRNQWISNKLNREKMTFYLKNKENKSIKRKDKESGMENRLKMIKNSQSCHQKK